MEDDESLEVLVARALEKIYSNDMGKLQHKHEQERQQLLEKYQRFRFMAKNDILIMQKN